MWSVFCSRWSEFSLLIQLLNYANVNLELYEMELWFSFSFRCLDVEQNRLQHNDLTQHTDDFFLHFWYSPVYLLFGIRTIIFIICHKSYEVHWGGKTRTVPFWQSLFPHTACSKQVSKRLAELLLMLEWGRAASYWVWLSHRSPLLHLSYFAYKIA